MDLGQISITRAPKAVTDQFLLGRKFCPELAATGHLQEEMGIRGRSQTRRREASQSEDPRVNTKMRVADADESLAAMREIAPDFHSNRED